MSNKQTECPYEVLGVSKNATDAEIKKAYRTLSKSNHPDKMGDASAQARINAAWDILSDPERKKRYDETGQTSMTEFLSRVMALLNNAMNQIIEQVPDVETHDIIGSCKSLIRSMRDQANNSIKNSNNSLMKSEKVLSRTKTKKDQIIILFLQTRVNLIKTEIKQAEEQVEFFSKVLVLLEDYTYELRVDEDSEDIHDVLAREMKRALGDNSEGYKFSTRSSGWGI